MPSPLKDYSVFQLMRDVANATTSSTVRFIVPYDGTLKKIQAVLGAAKTGDAILTTSRGATALTPTLTLTAAASAAGSLFSADFTYQPVKAGDIISVASDGGGAEAIDVVHVGITLFFSK